MTDSQKVIPLATEAYARAVNFLESLLSSNPPEHIRVACEISLSAMKQLEEESPFSDFLPFKEGTFFHTNYVRGFSALHIFSKTNFLAEEAKRQVIYLFGFVYAFVYENALKDGKYNQFSADVVGYYVTYGDHLDSFEKTRIELMKAKIVASFAIDSQDDIRRRTAELSNQILGAIQPIAEKIEKWNSELSNWETKSDALVKILKDQHSDLNFVGLAHAFSSLVKEKKIEKNGQVKILQYLGCLLVATPVVSIFIGTYFKIDVAMTAQWLSHALPIVAIEFLLLYFFRIALRNYYSVKAQLLQLELRYSICAFVEGYSSFAQGVKKGTDDKTLDRFEALIFSGITTDIQNIPSHFDGVEQIASLIKDLKGK